VGPDWPKDSRLADRLVLVGGPPRSGTTFAARCLNAHPQVMTAIDDHVYECWALYYYRNRTGLVADLRTRPVTRAECLERLGNYLVDGDYLAGVAPADKTAGLSPSPPRTRPDRGAIPPDLKTVRFQFPLAKFREDSYLCLKSPEISFVLPQLATLLPDARFIMVYRPLLEIAESMFRKGENVRLLAVYHRRWRNETSESGLLLPPPGVPEEWRAAWSGVTDFQRCLVYAASYMRAMIRDIGQIPANRLLLYNHAAMRSNPDRVFARWAKFLDIAAAGFDQAGGTGLKTGVPVIPDHMEREYRDICGRFSLERLASDMACLER